MLADQLDYVVGVDTHLDEHVLAVVAAAEGSICLLSQSPGGRATGRQSKGASPHQLRDCGLPKSD
jgi:hypothetical protein